MGLAGFLRRYIKDYAKIAQPITDLLRGYSNKKSNRVQNKRLERDRFSWTHHQQNAFNQLKKKLSEEVTLAYADFKKPFRLSTDASRSGLGAVLEQEDKQYRPVAFASGRTSSAEKHYPIHRLEWAVTEKFKDYLRNAPFVCYTDNNPLTYILKNAKLDATAQRGVASLEPFDFEIVYRDATNNTVADSLSHKYDEEDHDNNDIEKYKRWATDKYK